jgi:hypothetical protein
VALEAQEQTSACADLRSEPGRPDRSFIISSLILIAVLWIATRPYHGIVDDARFYALEALRQLHPAAFADDLYFRFGSQDRYTVFARLYAPFASLIGIGWAALILTVLGAILWLGGALYLATRLFRVPWQAFIAVAAAVILPGVYALSYGEPFVTPRLYGEALTLFALGFLLRERLVWTFLLLLLAGALHPLVALPGFAFVLLYLALGDPRWWSVVLGGALAAIGLSFTAIEPFASLRVTYDPEWLGIVTRWPADFLMRLLGTTALAILALSLAEPRERRFLWTALIVGLGGIAATLLGGDLARNLLIVQLQPWRATWLLILVANLFALPIYVRLWHQGSTADLTRLPYLAAIAFLLVAQFVRPVALIAAPMMVVAALYRLWQRASFRPRWLARPLLWLIIAASALISAVVLYAFIVIAAGAALEFRWRVESFLVAVAALSLSWFVFSLSGKDRPRAKRAFARLATVLTVAAPFTWYQMTPWQGFVEASAVPSALAQFLPASGQVYWEGGTDLLWLKLERPSYFSCAQGTGALFFRGTALAYGHRAQSFQPLRTLDFGVDNLCPGISGGAKSQRTRADLATLCTREPELAMVVLAQPVADADPKIWEPPVPFRDVRVTNGRMHAAEINRFYGYSCTPLR